MARILYKFIFKVFLVSCICISSFGPLCHGQSLGFEFYDESGKGELSFEYINGFIIVELIYNHTFPLNFIFDTGASNTIIHNKEVVDLFNPEYGRTFTIYGADLSTPLYAHLLKSVNLQHGKLVAPHQDILVLEDDYFNFKKLTGVDIHGILGADMFRNHKVKINYRKRIIEFYKYDYKKLKTNGFKKAQMAVQKSKPYINCPITLSNTSETPLKLLVDTGASVALLLDTESDTSLVLPDQIIPGNLGYGIGGVMEGYVGRVTHLDIGGKRLENVICHFQENQTSLDSLNLIFRHGLIGNFILDRFEIILDYPERLIYLKPARKWRRKFAYDKSGISFISVGIESNTFYIQHVLENSPAELAGLKSGDIIKNINNTPSTFLSYDGINRVLRGKSGKKVKIKVKRGETIIKRSFRLKDLI